MHFNLPSTERGSELYICVSHCSKPHHEKGPHHEGPLLPGRVHHLHKNSEGYDSAATLSADEGPMGGEHSQLSPHIKHHGSHHPQVKKEAI